MFIIYYRIMLKDLISSLNPVEKRYFKAGLGSDTQLLEVFDTIEKIGSTKNCELAIDLGDKHYFKLISVLKNQLYESILKSLRDFHRNNHIDFQFRNELTNIEILIHKKLLNSAHKKLKKLKTKLLQHERFTYLLEVLNIELVLHYQSENLNQFKVSIADVIENVEFAKEGIGKFYKAKSDYYYLNSVIENNREKIHEVEFDPNTNPTDKIRSANYFYQLTKIKWAIELREYHFAKQAAKSLAHLLIENPHELKKNRSQFIDVNYACALGFVLSGEIDNFHLHLENIELEDISGRYLINKRIERLLHLYLTATIALKTDEYQERIEQIWNDNHENFSRLFFERNAELYSIILTNNENYKLANRVNNELQNMKAKERDLEIYKRSLLRSLYLHSVRGNFDLFENKLNSIKRKKEIWTKEETAFLKKIKFENTQELDNPALTVF